MNCLHTYKDQVNFLLKSKSYNNLKIEELQRRKQHYAHLYSYNGFLNLVNTFLTQKAINTIHDRVHKNVYKKDYPNSFELMKYKFLASLKECDIITFIVCKAFLDTSKDNTLTDEIDVYYKPLATKLSTAKILNNRYVTKRRASNKELFNTVQRLINSCSVFVPCYITDERLNANISLTASESLIYDKQRKMTESTIAVMRFKHAQHIAKYCEQINNLLIYQDKLIHLCNENDNTARNLLVQINKLIIPGIDLQQDYEETAEYIFKHEIMHEINNAIHYLMKNNKLNDVERKLYFAGTEADYRQWCYDECMVALGYFDFTRKSVMSFNLWLKKILEQRFVDLKCKYKYYDNDINAIKSLDLMIERNEDIHDTFIDDCNIEDNDAKIDIEHFLELIKSKDIVLYKILYGKKENYTIEQIANYANVSASTVKRRLHDMQAIVNKLGIDLKSYNTQPVKYTKKIEKSDVRHKPEYKELCTKGKSDGLLNGAYKRMPEVKNTGVKRYLMMDSKKGKEYIAMHTNVLTNIYKIKFLQSTYRINLCSFLYFNKNLISSSAIDKNKVKSKVMQSFNIKTMEMTTKQKHKFVYDTIEASADFHFQPIQLTKSMKAKRSKFLELMFSITKTENKWFVPGMCSGLFLEDKQVTNIDTVQKRFILNSWYLQKNLNRLLFKSVRAIERYISRLLYNEPSNVLDKTSYKKLFNIVYKTAFKSTLQDLYRKQFKKSFKEVFQKQLE